MTSSKKGGALKKVFKSDKGSLTEHIIRHGVLWFKHFYYNRLGIFSILFLLVYFVVMDQGPDLLQSLNQLRAADGYIEFMSVGLLFLSCLTLSALVHYYPKLFYYKLAPLEEQPELEQHYAHVHPKIMASFILLIPFLGFLIALLESQWIIPTTLIALTLAQLLLIPKIYQWIGRRIDGFFNRTLKIVRYELVVFIYFVVLVIGLFILREYSSVEFSGLKLLALAYGGCSLSFILYLFIHKKRIKKILIDKVGEKIPLIALSILFSLVFLAFNLSPEFGKNMNPLICAISSLVFYTSLIHLLFYLGIKWEIKIVSILLLLAILYSGITTKFGFNIFEPDYYEINYIDDAKREVKKRRTIEEYACDWVYHRQHKINSFFYEEHRRYPIFVVSAQGGGSRGAYWTLIAHHQLNAGTNYYRDHLFGLTGASGGNVGNSIFLSLKNDNTPDKSIKAASDRIFGENYVSSAVAFMLGRDVLGELFGLDVINNRADQLEEDWVTAYGKENCAFNCSFLEPWKDNNRNPVLLVNTTHVQTGRHYLVSPFKFTQKNFPSHYDLLKSIDSIRPKKTIKMSTAALLNARFPYFTPGGRVTRIGQFVDAGYYENFGALTASHLIALLDDVLKSDSLREKVEIISIVTVNSPPNLAEHKELNRYDPSGKKPSLVGELLIPPYTAIRTRDGHANQGLAQLKSKADTTVTIDIYNKGMYWDQNAVIVPLARYLSKIALRRMQILMTTGHNARIIRMLKRKMKRKNAVEFKPEQQTP